MAFNNYVEQDDLEILKQQVNAELLGITQQEVAEENHTADDVTAEQNPSTKEVEPVQNIDIDEERAKIEKEMRKKYLSQVSKKDKELKEALERIETLKGNYDESSLDDIEAILDYKLAKKERASLAEKEEKIFYSNNPEAKSYKEDIDAIIDKNPSLSYEFVYNGLLGVNGKGQNTQSSQNLNIGGQPPKAINNPQQDYTKEELYAMAEKELRDAAW